MSPPSPVVPELTPAVQAQRSPGPPGVAGGHDDGTDPAFRLVGLATDGLPRSERAYEAATSIARAFGARLHLLVVTPTHLDLGYYAVVAPAPEPPLPESEGEEKYYREIAARQGERAVRDGIVSVTRETPVGRPAEAILAAVERTRADLIVLGARDLSTVHRVLVGSTSSAVAALSAAPVLVARGRPPTGPAGRPPPFDRIVAAVDPSGDSTAALRRAVALSRGLAVPLTVISVVPPLVAGGLRSHEAQRRQAELLLAAEDQLARARQRASEGGVAETTTELLRGPPSETILDYLDEGDAHLLVVGSRGRTLPRELLLGSVSSALLHHAPCSILIERGHPRERPGADGPRPQF